VGEYQQLIAILKLAAPRDETFDQRLLLIDPLKRRTREKHGLPLDQLRHLAGHAPEHQRRLSCSAARSAAGSWSSCGSRTPGSTWAPAT